ncbi:MAG: RsmE family RNA methyltransferase, partial [Candidatus Binatia bacterium]
MARFFLPKENIQDDRGIITGEELIHMRRVLRLKPGDRVTVFDDTGLEHEAIIRSFGDDYGEVALIKSYRAERESPLEVTLALGLTKGEKMDLVVEKATELGVRAIAPFVSRYTVPRLNEAKIARRADRWQKIVLNAAKQCGRAQVPNVLALADFRELLRQPWPGALKLLFWEKESSHALGEIYETNRDLRSV